MLISPLGDSAIVIRLGEAVDAETSARVRALTHELERDPPTGTSDIVPAFSSVAVYFQRPLERFAEVQREVEARALRIRAGTTPPSPRTVEVPVCYGGEFGPDLEVVAKHAGVSVEHVVAAHQGADYQVNAIGFLPGFPYLGGLPAQLATPRRATPRAEVPSGSVGIGGAQTGVYPMASPGGWNLIGRTPLRLFDAARADPAMLRAGDRVKFSSISSEQFERLSGADARPSLSATTTTSAELAATGLAVLKPGMLTTVQDLGRFGHRRHGVPVSGAADAFALRLANLLVGNTEDVAGLEFTLVGPELEFRTGALVALGGADFGLPLWRPFWVRAGEKLQFGPARSGCRGYLAIAGGISVAPVLGSRSTFVRAQLGGWAGRALREGDVLPLSRVARRVLGRWRIDSRILPEYGPDPEVRVTCGAQAAEFDEDWQTSEFKVSPHSDRMGIRLTGDRVIRSRGGELTSSPIAPGTVQVPPDAQPIVLLADAQTIGGYPQLAHVAAVDLPLVAQLRAGDALRFQLVTVDEAHDAWNARERALGLLREGLAQKLA